MDPAKLYAVVEDQLAELVPTATIPAELLWPLSAEVDSLLGEAVLIIGAWDEPERGPLILALTETGQLVIVVIANPRSVSPLADTIRSIDAWVGLLDLRALAELSGDRAEFYEGLLDLSPDSSVTVSAVRRYVLLSAAEALDLSSVSASVPEALVEAQFFDVRHAPGGPAILTLRELANPAHSEPAVRIDLTSPSHPIPDLAEIPSPLPAVGLVAGATYPIETLPQLFSPFGEGLEPLSDAMFAINNSIVLVINIPERRRDTPIEDPDTIRWDADRAQITLFEAQHADLAGTDPDVHVFVESRDYDHAVYLGTAECIDSAGKATDDETTVWFRFSPPLTPDLYRLIRKGRLPEHLDRLTNRTP